jgi:hypothetical protein
VSKRVPLNEAIEHNFLIGNSDLNDHNNTSDILDGLPKKETKERTVRITVDLPVSVHLRLKRYCLDKGTNIIELVTYLLDKVLPKN